MATTSTQQNSAGPAPLNFDPLQVNLHNVPDRSQQPSDAQPEAHTNNLGGSGLAPSLTRNDTIGPVVQDQIISGTLAMGDVDLDYYRPLYLAALKGDWETARRFIEGDRGALTATISILNMTALHVAACTGQAQFVERLVELMPKEALAMIDIGGCTALHYAAMSGSTEIAKALVSKNSALTQITDSNGNVPLHTAVFLAVEHEEVVRYLSMVTTDEHPSCPFTGPLAGRLICFLTHGGFHDISLYLLQRYPNLVTAKDPEGLSLLGVLALQPSNFPSGSRFKFWERWIYQFVPVEVKYTLQHPERGDTENPHQSSEHLTEMPTLVQSRTYITEVLQWLKWLFWKAIEKLAPGFKQIRDAKFKHKCALKLVKHVCIHVSSLSNQEMFNYFVGEAILNIAASCGIVEIVKECLQFFPDMIWVPTNDRTLMQVAVEHRQEKIFNLMYERIALNKAQAYFIAEPNNTFLHLVAKLAPYPQLSYVSGGALQLQRELQWFKAVESFVHPAFKELRMDSRTAWHIFSDEHKKLREEGAKWMRDTSNSCMLVATLIATVVFAAAFTVPGGNDSSKGIPIFLGETSFIVFAVSDALALFSSATSILMFLAILTSRYAEEDFLESLPKRMIIGLASLFLAIVSMMVAFGATLSIVLSQRLNWVSIPITLLASVPVTIFAMLQLPLFIQMVQSTYGSGIFRPQKIW